MSDISICARTKFPNTLTNLMTSLLCNTITEIFTQPMIIMVIILTHRNFLPLLALVSTVFFIFFLRAWNSNHCLKTVEKCGFKKFSTLKKHAYLREGPASRPQNLVNYGAY